MKALIEYVAKSLVERPAEVEVTEETVADGSILIKLAAAPQDMGRIIGRQGRNAKAMRTLLNAKATREQKRVSLLILE